MTAGVLVDRVRAVSEADAASFHTLRPRLFGIAYRVLGTATDADDVVQDAWIRWQGTDRSKVRDPAAFLATTTTRLALNVGASARVRHETHAGEWPSEAVDTAADPALAAEQRDALEVTVRVLLEKLTPTERAAFVLREAFDYPYRQIAEVLALTEANARQLVNRARSHISGARRSPVSATEHQALLEALVAAAQTGDLAGLEQLLASGSARGPCQRGNGRCHDSRSCPVSAGARPIDAHRARLRITRTKGMT